MALGYKARRRLSMLALVLGLPAYIVAAISIVNLFDRPPIWLELIIYVVLGVAWAFVLKPIFKGVGKADPDAPSDE
jgi:membrane protein implicated in regulation of membrane protease activity